MTTNYYTLRGQFTRVVAPGERATFHQWDGPTARWVLVADVGLNSPEDVALRNVYRREAKADAPALAHMRQHGSLPAGK